MVPGNFRHLGVHLGQFRRALPTRKKLNMDHLI